MRGRFPGSFAGLAGLACASFAPATAIGPVGEYETVDAIKADIDASGQCGP